MKVLFDQNLSVKLCPKLSDLFPGSSQTGLLGLNRAEDRAVWNAAREGEFILVTQDSDFAERAALFHPRKLYGFAAGTTLRHSSQI